MATLGRVTLLMLVLLTSVPRSGYAQDNGDLPAMGGGRLVSWVLISGGNARRSGDANLQTAGAAVRLHDRLELSFTHEWFGNGSKPHLGPGYQLQMDGIGARLNLVGDAIYDPDRRLPLTDLGSRFTIAGGQGPTPRLGMHSAEGVDIYISAAKLLQAESLLFDGAARAASAGPFMLPSPDYAVVQ